MEGHPPRPHGSHGSHGPIKYSNCQKELPKPEHPPEPPKEGEERKPPVCPFCGKESLKPKPLACQKCGAEISFPHHEPHGHHTSWTKTRRKRR